MGRGDAVLTYGGGATTSSITISNGTSNSSSNSSTSRNSQMFLHPQLGSNPVEPLLTHVSHALRESPAGHALRSLHASLDSHLRSAQAAFSGAQQQGCAAVAAAAGAAHDSRRARRRTRQCTTSGVELGTSEGPQLRLSRSSDLPFAQINGARRRAARGEGIAFVSGTEPATASSAPASSASSAPAGEKSAAAGSTVTQPSAVQLMAHPLALLSYVPKDAAMFVAGAVAGATAKTLTAPLDRWKLMLQVKSVQDPTAPAKASVGLLESFVAIGKDEGVLAYWKGNLPQVLRIIPYSAVQLFAYEFYKKTFQGKRSELPVPARLAAGACAGMTSTLITYPLDVLRLRLAVEPGAKQMSVVAMRMLREEGMLAFYKGLGPSLISIAPYIALNFCAFDLIKKSIPEKYRKTPQASFVTALCATTFATVMCYPLDTVRRQMQMKNSPFTSIIDAVPGIIARDGIGGLYRGFIANALKNLPNSSIRLTTYDTAKQLIISSKTEYERLVAERTEEEAAAAAKQQAQPLAS